MELKDYLLIGAGVTAASLIVVGAFLLAQAKKFAAEFKDFRVGVIPGNNTTRENTGETASDFQFYPHIFLTPDVDGEYVVTWSYSNILNGAPEYFSGTITNVFPSLVAGQTYELELRDNREPSSVGGICEGVSCRDTRRNESIAIGDLDLQGLEGSLHSFQSNVEITVTSPSGESVTINGKLGPENFKYASAFSSINAFNRRVASLPSMIF